jgi:glycerophosphoryl diester phosphodiesterase
MLSARPPDLIAQRGDASTYPQNSLPALRSALELGVRHLAFDVQLSADRHPVLLEDPDLTGSADLELNALEMTWQELAELSVPGPRPPEGEAGIAKLAQAVELLERQPSATAFVELNRQSLRAFGHDTVVRRVCETLRTAPRQCVIVSYDLTALHYVRHVSSYRIGWRLSEYTSLSALKCDALAPDYVFCDRALLGEGTSKLWRGPWRWAVCEVMSRTQALDLAARGAHLVGTTAVRNLFDELRRPGR